MNYLDLVFLNRIDWKPFLIALEQLQGEQQGEQRKESNELWIHSITSRDDGALVVRIVLSSEVDKERIAQSFIEKYEEQSKQDETIEERGIAEFLLFNKPESIETIVRDSYEKAQQASSAINRISLNSSSQGDTFYDSENEIDLCEREPQSHFSFALQ